MEKRMKKKIKYLDWWNGFDYRGYRIHSILNKSFDMEISDNPDYIFCSVYSKEALKYDCVRVFYTGECFCPDFNLFDYAIGFENIDYGDRYVRCPNYLMNPKYDLDVQRMLGKHKDFEIQNKTEFCSFVVSNGNADHIREHFFEKLSLYKKVNSGGRYKNNIGEPNGVKDKFEFQSKHKFSIAFENSSHPGYTTEKLVQAFAAGTIPIYWGDPNVTELFNERAMIILRNAEEIPLVLDRIKEIDNDDKLFQSMLREPAVKDIAFFEDSLERLGVFLNHILSQPLSEAYRRPRNMTIASYYQQKPDNKCNGLWERIFGHK